MASIQTLVERLQAVETAVTTDGVASTVPEKLDSLISEEGKTIGSLVQRVEELGAEWKLIEDPTFRNFFEKYTALQDLLNTDVELKELLVSNTMKESILLSGFDDFQTTAKQLEAVKSLETVMDKTPISNISEVEKKLSSMEAAMAVKADAVAKFHSEVEAFFDSYNTIIGLLSQKFLLWDAAITAWEQKK